jgi:hypothetical protein
LVYYNTWDIEGSLARPRETGTYDGGTTSGGVDPGPPSYVPVSRGIAGLKQPSLCSMTKQTLGRRNTALVQSTELDLSSPMPILEHIHAERSTSTR